MTRLLLPKARCLMALLVLLAAGCAPSMSTKIASPFAQDGAAGDVRHQERAVLRDVEERNRTVERDPEWISRAYENFMVRELASLEEKDYAGYARYLDNGAVYIVVHPAYYTFFHDHELFPDHHREVSRQNAMETFLEGSAYSSKSRLIKAQEKMLRDFLEYMSTTKKLVVLILPHDYRTFAAYKFRKHNDEFMRFINEVTNESESVLYLYSKKPNRGTLAAKDRRRLLKLLYAVRAREILVGGGYIGRCLEDFYKDVEQYYSDDKIFVVPEITAISPSDIGSSAASDMLNTDGTIDIPKLTAAIQANALGNQDIVPRTRNLRAGDPGLPAP